MALQKRGDMFHHGYLEYVAGFANLSPYELDHLCDRLVLQMEKCLDAKQSDAEIPFSIADLKDLMTKTMRSIYSELAQAKKVDFDAQLERLKAMSYIDDPLIEKDIARHRKSHTIPFERGGEKKDPAATRQGQQEAA